MAAQRLQEWPIQDADLVQQGSAWPLNLRVWVSKRERGVCSQGRRPKCESTIHLEEAFYEKIYYLKLKLLIYK